MRIVNVTFDCADPGRVADFWALATGYDRADGDDPVRLVAPDDRSPRQLLFFRVPEAKTAKNRVHVDLASRDLDADVARLVAAGATETARHERPAVRWVVLADPEGNEFCVSGRPTQPEAENAGAERAR